MIAYHASLSLSLSDCAAWGAQREEPLLAAAPITHQASQCTAPWASGHDAAAAVEQRPLLLYQLLRFPRGSRANLTLHTQLEMPSPSSAPCKLEALFYVIVGIGGIVPISNNCTYVYLW